MATEGSHCRRRSRPTCPKSMGITKRLGRSCERDHFGLNRVDSIEAWPPYLGYRGSLPIVGRGLQGASVAAWRTGRETMDRSLTASSATDRPLIGSALPPCLVCGQGDEALGHV